MCPLETSRAVLENVFTCEDSEGELVARGRGPEGELSNLHNLCIILAQSVQTLYKPELTNPKRPERGRRLS